MEEVSREPGFRTAVRVSKLGLGAAALALGTATAVHTLVTGDYALGHASGAFDRILQASPDAVTAFLGANLLRSRPNN